MEKNKIIQEFLTEIIPDIENIDDGCKSCIHGFCDGLNDEIKKYSLRLEYNESYPIKVKVVNI